MNDRIFGVLASAVLGELRKCGVTHLFAISGHVQVSLFHLLEEQRVTDIQVVNCATEDEAVAGHQLGCHERFLLEMLGI